LQVAAQNNPTFQDGQADRCVIKGEIRHIFCFAGYFYGIEVVVRSVRPLFRRGTRLESV
jgi:hypothetical protein